MRRAFAAVCAVLAAWALGGCATSIPTTAIKASDSSVTLPTVRVSVQIGSAEGPPPEPAYGQALEFNAATAKGSDTQTLSAGQPPVIFGDPSTTFNAPQDLRHEFEFAYVDFSWRGRAFFGLKPIGLEVLAGLSYLETELTVSSATQRATDKRNAAGLSLGVGGVWRIRPSTRVQARVTLIAPLGEFDEVTRLEAFVVQALGRNAAVRAGYAGWRIRVDSGSASAIKVDFAGPSLGLDLSF